MANRATLWHKYFMAIKFYSLNLNHLDKKLTDFNYTSFVLNVMAIYRIVRKFGELTRFKHLAKENLAN